MSIIPERPQSVLLYDGEQDEAEDKLARANERLLMLQQKDDDRIAHGLTPGGEVCLEADEIVSSIGDIAQQANLKLILVHISACEPDYLSREVKQWPEAEKLNVCILLYSGVGVTEEAAAPMVDAAVKKKLAFVGFLEKSIDDKRVQNEIIGLIDWFRKDASPGTDAKDVARELDKRVTQLNLVFPEVATRLHILLSAYLASMGVDPRVTPSTGKLLVSTQREREVVRDKLKKGANWKRFFSNVDLLDALRNERVTPDDAVKSICRCVSSESELPELDLVHAWQQLDSSLGTK